jgi:hypothetical protein
MASLFDVSYFRKFESTFFSVGTWTTFCFSSPCYLFFFDDVSNALSNFLKPGKLTNSFKCFHSFVFSFEFLY